MDSSYALNYGRFEDSHYYNVNEVEVCEICEDYSHSAYDCSYYPKLQNMLDDEELSSTQPISHLDENMNVDTLKNVEVDEEENEMKIEVISERREEPQKESKEDQPLVLVKPPTIPCILVKPYKGVEVNEHSHIFYTVDTFVLDYHYATDSFVLDYHYATYSFVLEVPNELLNLKEGVHASLPKYVDAPFVVDISKGEGTT
ncbi:hypothetical protein Scep_023577 [Stephania cephalantha]|uniref:Uncharacterized protein n=1 Tax=Stephania cephalantha TaxID=152367 RepID=A0AAP0EXV7_9MAGN